MVEVQGRRLAYTGHVYMGKGAVQKLVGEHQLKESGLVGVGQGSGISLMSVEFMSLSSNNNKGHNISQISVKALSEVLSPD